MLAEINNNQWVISYVHLIFQAADRYAKTIIGHDEVENLSLIEGNIEKHRVIRGVLGKSPPVSIDTQGIKYSTGISNSSR